MSKRFEDPKHNAAFDRYIDVMTQLISKYGPAILEKQSLSEAGDSASVRPGTGNPCGRLPQEKTKTPA